MHTARLVSGNVTVQRPARRLADSRWGDRSLRFGLAARGFVFVVFGYLVARVASGALGTGSTHNPASLTGVPQTVAEQSGGRFALIALGTGLALYAVFSAVDAALHHDDETPGAKRWGDRALSLFGFAMYSAFSAYCFITAANAGGGRRTSGQEDRQKALWSARVLRWPGGAVWLGLLATVLLVIFGFLVSRAIRASFRPRLHQERMSPLNWKIAVALGAAGYLGRALLFGIVGGCIMTAAIEHDPSNGQGVDGSVRILAAHPAGAALLWLVAALLFAYAAYMFYETRYRRV